MPSAKPTVATVLDAIAAELRARPVATTTGIKFRLQEIRRHQLRFREAPIGGRLPHLKRLVYWFTASAFDRQAKVIEALLDVIEDLVDDTEILRAGGATPPPLPVTSQDHQTASRLAPPPGLEAALATDAEMLPSERLLLYSLVRSLRPQSCLEIGTNRGGSAAIIASALNDNGSGSLTCIDPSSRIPRELWLSIRHRIRLIEEPSPAGVFVAARESAKFDFVLVDGDHSRAGVHADIESLLPNLADPAYLLFHDCYWEPVASAIDESLTRHTACLADCGVIGTARADSTGKSKPNGGLRLLRYQAIL